MGFIFKFTVLQFFSVGSDWKHKLLMFYLIKLASQSLVSKLLEVHCDVVVTVPPLVLMAKANGVGELVDYCRMCEALRTQ